MFDFTGLFGSLFAFITLLLCAVVVLLCVVFFGMGWIDWGSGIAVALASFMLCTRVYRRMEGS